MTPAKGLMLAQYRLEEKIGAGGMGEVWKAFDTKLERPVAIKVLPDEFSTDGQRLARFEREARVLASLNHANIAVIHGLDRSGGLHFLALELVGGEDLSQRLRRGPIPVDEAIAIARQVAEALEAAHDSGVVHRDLKPANIQITPDGKVKVLDFGLAKAFDADAGSSSSSASLSPTMTAAATLSGVILGTAAYMSPEQARGRPVDRRADIWAFGCVFYEMLTGSRLFEGETISDTLASVLKSEPDLSALPSSTPAGIRALLRRCLEKDPKRRLQAIGDARIAIEEALASPGPPVQTASPARRPIASGWSGRLGWVLAVVFAVVSALLMVGRPKPASGLPLVRSSIEPPPKSRFDFSYERSGSLSISPDGRMITFPLQTPDGEQMLWIRSLDSLEARPLQGTRYATWPFWSPDSQHIAFFADGKLKKIDLSGSPPITICDAEAGRAGDWSRDGTIIFAPTPNTGIYSVPAAGGQPRALTHLDEAHGETTHRWPMFLPDGRHFLYMAGTHNAGTQNEANAIYLAEIGKPGQRRLMLARSNLGYTRGQLFFVRDRILLAQRFDPDRLELSGDPVPVATGVGYEAAFFQAEFAVAGNGTLVYRTGAAISGTRLTWVGRDGREIARIGGVGAYQYLTLSPDGKRLAYSATDSDAGMDIWILDLARSVPSRLTFGPSGQKVPVWSPDGQQIVYAISALHDDLFIRPAAGGKEEVLLRSTEDKLPTDWSRDGRYLVYNQEATTPSSRQGVWVLPMRDKGKPWAFVDNEFNEMDGRLSPDGRWMLYSSDESGRKEIYVAPFPGPGGKWQVSTNGALTGFWVSGGKEIVYFLPDRSVVSVAVRAAATTFEVDTPRTLFRNPLALDGVVTSDGQRFLLALRPEEEQDLPITLVTNWPEAKTR